MQNKGNYTVNLTVDSQVDLDDKLEMINQKLDLLLYDQNELVLKLSNSQDNPEKNAEVVERLRLQAQGRP